MNKNFLGMALGFAALTSGDHFIDGNIPLRVDGAGYHNSLNQSRKARKKRKHKRRIASRMRAYNR